MPTVEIEGKVVSKTQPDHIRDNLTKETITIFTREESGNREFENNYKIEFVNRNRECLNDIEVGDTVVVGCNLRGKNNADGTKNWISLDGYKLTLK